MENKYLPPDVQPNQVQYCLGLMSDTHMPARWAQLHDSLPHIFADVDMILHAGDVGELWVLDELSKIAPTIAVHGNDEPDDTPKMLPEKQIVTVGEHRILLWHSHYADRIDEMESRRGPEMLPKLERIARHGKRVGAQIVHFGHWHIPLICEVEGVTLINAGGIASGNLIVRQLVQTVALLFLLQDGRFHITHVDLNTQEIHQPQDVVDMKFATVLNSYSGSILSPELQKIAANFQGKPDPILVEILWQLASDCWWGDKEMITIEDILQAAHGELDYLLQ